VQVFDIKFIADVCKCIAPPEFPKEPNAIYLLPGERIQMLLRSGKETHIFSNLAYVQIVGANASTGRRLVRRFDYVDSPISRVCYESAGMGMSDRDVELKFHIKGESISIDIWKSEAQTAIFFYKVLAAIENFQGRNELGLTLAKGAVSSSKGGIDPLVFAEEARTRYCPEDYSSVFQRILAGGTV
jgi:hypothetical protein